MKQWTGAAQDGTTAKKGVETLLRAVPHLAQRAHLAIAGEGPRLAD